MMKAFNASDTVRQLQAKGLRVTPQRAAIYANLLNRTDHPTVEQLLADLNSDLPLSSKATVYSALAALQTVGLVRQVLLEEGVTRYDAHVAPHHHFHCQCCGSIQDLAWDLFGSLTCDRLPPGLQVNSHELTVHGICERCSSCAE
jgi:Fe2+ or Zn2+ uptake regulation protein